MNIEDELREILRAAKTANDNALPRKIELQHSGEITVTIRVEQQSAETKERIVAGNQRPAILSGQRICEALAVLDAMKPRMRTYERSNGVREHRLLPSFQGGSKRLNQA